ncbi:ATP-binding protein [Streptomyces nodosus]|uniref:ATP-binding protein n=1 Tax=Streptomyces nodosus TaxID=40318 RepID=UPI0037F199FA
MPPTLGWYPTPTPTGFVLHLSATPRHLRAVRGLVEKTLCGAGAADDLTQAVQLVLSELCGNAVRACGDFVPRPRLTGVRLDDPHAESGRGLALVDLLAPGWDVAVTPIGKQIRCRVPVPGN